MSPNSGISRRIRPKTSALHKFCVSVALANLPSTLAVAFLDILQSIHAKDLTLSAFLEALFFVALTILIFRSIHRHSPAPLSRGA